MELKKSEKDKSIIHLETPYFKV